MLMVSNATFLFMTYVWFHAMQFDDGEIRACVDCAGEGLLELSVIAGLWALSTVLLAVWLRPLGAPRQRKLIYQ